MVIQIKDINDYVIFEYKKENNTIKDTLEEAVKRGINLHHVNLKGANLEGVDLRGVYLYGANFRNANLEGANLYAANLSNANLKKANLKDANLRAAWLTYANLKDVNLYGTTLYEATLYGSENIPDGIPMACPESGSFIGWKKVFDNGSYLIKLEIPADAKRSSATSKKCRCSKAKVLKITNIRTRENIEEIFNFNFAGCLYRVGEMVYPDSFDKDRWKECSHGIHFFIDKQDAINY